MPGHVSRSFARFGSLLGWMALGQLSVIWIGFGLRPLHFVQRATLCGFCGTSPVFGYSHALFRNLSPSLGGLLSVDDGHV